MAITTISENFEIAIPEEMRAKLHLRPGQQIKLIQIGNRIELVPIGTIQEARGFLRGISSTVIKRDPDRI